MVPTEIVKLAGAHPYLVGGVAAILVVGGYSYYRRNKAPTDNGADYNQTAFTYGMPMVVPQGSGGSGIVDSVTAPTSDGVSQMAIFDFERLKETHDYSIASRSLDNQLSIAQLNYAVALGSIQATNYQTSAQLAQTFIRSKQMFSAGKIGDLTFAFLGSGIQITGTSKKAKSAAAQQVSSFMSMLNNATVKNLLGVPPNAQSAPRSRSIAPYGSGAATSSMRPYGSSSVASVVSGASANSTSVPASAISASAPTIDGYPRTGAASKFERLFPV